LTEDKETQGRVALIWTITLTWLFSGLRKLDDLPRLSAASAASAPG
jgi:hypothetical protein